MMDNLLRLRNHALNPAEPEYSLAGKCVHGASGSGSQTSASSSILSSRYRGTGRDRDVRNGVYLYIATELFQDTIGTR